MANVKVQLPQMGEGVIEAKITRWLIDLNGKVEEDEPLVEIATDKVDSEISSPTNGILTKVFFNEGEMPKVGDVIAIVQSAGSNIEDIEHEEDSKSNKNDIPNLLGTTISEEVKQPEIVVEKKGKNAFVTPFIRHYASQRGISFEELQKVNGSGEKGRVTKQDILDYFKTEKGVNGIHNSDLQLDTELNQQEKINYEPQEGEEVIEIDRTRKLIAERMMHSVRVAPHVTSTVEADITHIVQWREEVKEAFLSHNNARLTYTPIIVEQVTKALKLFPSINVSLFGNKIIKKNYINIGIATALSDGNLIVPVIKNADHHNLTKLAQIIGDQTRRARAGKLMPGETTGGTFTITNLGQFNNIFGTPIINQPESAILAVGAIKKKPWIVNTEAGQTIGIRDILTLSLSYDHRIIDGSLGGAFLSKIGELLEQSTPKI